METRKNGMKIVLAVLITLLLLVIAGIAYMQVSKMMRESSYTEAVETAEKYLAQNNYDRAIIKYREAIEINPEQDQAYLALADIYTRQENYSKAAEILRAGYERTQSFRLRRCLNQLEQRKKMVAKADDQDSEKIDLLTASQDISWDTSFVQKIVNYTFDDYRKEFGSVVSAEKDSDGWLKIRHQNLNAVCYYKNTEDNKKIVDGSRKIPYNDGMPEKIVLDSIENLFRNFEGGVSLNRMQMLFGETVTPKTLEGRNYIENKEEDLIVRVETDSAGNITSPNGWNELILPLANERKSSEGTLSGVVVDAVTGNGVNHAQLTFTPKNASHKTQKAKTDETGSFTVSLDADMYTIRIEADGYIGEEFQFTIEKGRSYSGEQFVISPELSGEARIVLEWNAQPLDLDSYLLGATEGGSSVNVNFRHKEASASGRRIAELDLDDMDGYGPETTTIYDLNGTYTFVVSDYLNTETLSQYGAVVKIYLPGQNPVTIELNRNAGIVNQWKVCTIDHGKLTVLNEPMDEAQFNQVDK